MGTFADLPLFYNFKDDTLLVKYKGRNLNLLNPKIDLKIAHPYLHD